MNSQIFSQIKRNFPRLSKEITFILLGQIIAALGSLIGVRLLTGKLTPAVYGEISLGLTVGVLFQQTLFGPISGSFLRFFSVASEKKEMNAFIKAVLKSTLQSTLISFIIIILVVGVFILKDLTSLVGLILLSFLYMLISSYNTFLDNLQNAARQRIIVAWHQGIGSWLKYLLAVLLIILLSPTSTVAMGGFLFSALVVFASQLWFFLRSKYFRQENGETVDAAKIDQWVHSFWKYAAPSILWGLFTWAQLSSDRWALGLFASTSDVGLYTALYQLGYYPVSFLSGIVLQFLSPILFQWSGDATQENRVQKAAKFIRYLVIVSMTLSILLALAAYLLHRQIFSLLVSPEYQSVSPLLPWMVLAGGTFSSGQFATIHFLNEINPQKLIFSKISTSILGFVLNFIFARVWGIRGIIAAVLLYSVVYFLAILLLMKIQSNQKSKKDPNYA